MLARKLVLAVGSLAVVTLVACKVSVPDVGEKVFRCKGPDDCASGYGCWFAPTQNPGELGYCTPQGQPAVACGDAFCKDGEVCVKADSSGRVVECHKTCSSDAACNPTGLCAVAHTLDDSLVGVCAACPVCSSGRQCAKARGAVDLSHALYCNAPGQDCSNSGDTDGDQMSGCMDADCMGYAGCGQCGNFQLDSGEPCDGYLVAPSQSCPAGTTGTPRCTAGCQIDYRSCTSGNGSQTCNNGTLDPNEECDQWNGTVKWSKGGPDCDVWSPGTVGQVTCKGDCTVDRSPCQTAAPYCGDGIVNNAEQCEPSGPAPTMTCSQMDPALSGALACTSYCYFDVSSCTVISDVCGKCIAAGGIIPNPLECGPTTACASDPHCVPWTTTARATSASSGARTSMFFDSAGKIWIAWETSSGISAAMYSPSSGWADLGSSVDTAPAAGTKPAISLDNTGLPVVAYVTTTPAQRVYLARWNGSSWMEVTAGSASGDGLTGTVATAVGAPVLARNGNGDLRLAVVMSNGTIRVWAVMATSVTSLPTPPGTTGTDVALALDPSSGDTLIGFLQGTGFFSSRYSSSWSAAVAIRAGTSSPALAIDLTGTAFFAWNDGGGDVAVMSAAPGGDWTPMPGSNMASVASGVPSLGRVALASEGGHPAVAWSEAGPAGITTENKVLAFEGPGLGWRGYAGTECPASGVDNASTTGNDAPAVAIGPMGSGLAVCIAYVAHPLAPASAELRVSCHPR